MAAIKEHPLATASSEWSVLAICYFSNAFIEASIIAGILVPHPTISTEKMSLSFTPESLIVSWIKFVNSWRLGAINSSNSGLFNDLFKSKSSIKHSILIPASWFADKMILAFSIDSNILILAFGFVHGSTLFLSKNSCPSFYKIEASKFLAPKFLFDQWAIILTFFCVKLAIVTVVYPWPTSTNATFVGSFSLNSFLLKNPYDIAIAVLSFTNFKQFTFPILHASNTAYLSTAE